MTDLQVLTDESRSAFIGEVSAPLSSILEKYYLVNGNNFFESSHHEVFKHQVLHLSKMINKVVRYQSDTSDRSAEEVLKTEVAPDLLIYAQEVFLKASEQCWRPANELFQRETALKSLLLHDEDERFETLLPRLSAASATLADICDRNDHSQSHVHDLSNDVAIPFTHAAATIFKKFEIDPDVVYRRRLESMIAKYDDWVLPA
jgi:hypothetical protein